MSNGTLVISSEIIAKNANYIGGYLKLVVDTIQENSKKQAVKRLDVKRYFGKSFDMAGASPLELVFRPYLKEQDGVMGQFSKEVKFGSNDIVLFAFAFDADKKEDGSVRDADIVWLPYNADDFENAVELHKDMFPVVRDLYGIMGAMAHSLDQSDEYNYQQTLIRLGDLQENAQYCAERGLAQIPPQMFSEQFALTELFSNIVQLLFAMTEDAVNGRNVSRENREGFVGIAEYVSEQQKLQTNIYGGGFGFGAQPTFAQQLFAAQAQVKK